MESFSDHSLIPEAVQSNAITQKGGAAAAPVRRYRKAARSASGSGGGGGGRISDTSMTQCSDFANLPGEQQASFFLKVFYCCVFCFQTLFFYIFSPILLHL